LLITFFLFRVVSFDFIFFLDANRDINGIFNLYNRGSYHLMISDQYFSLLKFVEPDEDLDLNCLVGHLNSSSSYIAVYPVDCKSRVANSYICRMPYYECINNPQGVHFAKIWKAAFCNKKPRTHFLHSQINVQWPPLGPKYSGCCWQVVIYVMKGLIETGK